jgi:hypothetical protein
MMNPFCRPVVRRPNSYPEVPWALSSHAAPFLLKKTRAPPKNWPGPKKPGPVRPRPESTTLLPASEQATDLHGREGTCSSCWQQFWSAG